MKQNLVNIVELDKLLQNSHKVLIGVSGGADSMALLHTILRYRDVLNKEFKVLHVDHQISKESADWSDVVMKYCNDTNIECEIAKVNVTDWGKNLEQAARYARYDAFSKQNCDTILLAHHANDQIETFFLKLLRGSGVKGLKGMSVATPCWFDTNKTIVRPFLGCNRRDIEEYVSVYSIPYITDPSNSDTKFDRNWVRHKLVPMIEDRNSLADLNILKCVGIQQETYSLLNDLADIDRTACTLPSGDLDWTKVKQLPVARIKNMFMHICSLHDVVDVSTHNIEAFANGLLVADTDSKNEMRMKTFYIRKLGKRILINK